MAKIDRLEAQIKLYKELVQREVTLTTEVAGLTAKSRELGKVQKRLEALTIRMDRVVEALGG